MHHDPGYHQENSIFPTIDTGRNIAQPDDAVSQAGIQQPDSGQFLMSRPVKIDRYESVFTEQCKRKPKSKAIVNGST